MSTLLNDKKYNDTFLWRGSTVSRLQSHYEETVYLLPLTPHNLLVLIWSTSEGWVDLGATQIFETATPGLGTYSPNH